MTIAKTLYIEIENNVTVSLDCAALVVKQKGKALQYFPLKRITKVFAKVHSQFTTEALIACAERNIQIFFRDRHKVVVARVMGMVGITECHAKGLNKITDNSDNYRKYCFWLSCLKHKIEYRMRKKQETMGFPFCRSNGLSRRTAFGNQSVDENNFKYNDIFNLMKANCDAWMSVALHRYGLSIRGSGWCPDFPDILNDLSLILMCSQKHHIKNVKIDSINALDQEKLLIECMEHHQSRYKNMAEFLAKSLVRFLKTLR